MDDDDDADNDNEQPRNSSSSDHHSKLKMKTSSVLIQVPSYEEVIRNTQPKSNAPPSLFVPSQTFSQAFAAIKNTEFYIPPPSTTTTTTTSSSSSRKNGEPEASPSVSTRPSTSANSIHKTNAILVSQRQKGNPLLKYIRNVRWNFAEVIPDFVLGANSCALYLSLRYHLLHPDYLYFRIRELQKNFRLRLVLCHVDVEDVVKPLLEVTRTAMFHDCTLLCGWSLEECGRYLETIKVYENKPADIIQGHMDTDYLSRLNHALTTIRHVNKTDVVTLGSTFGSLAHIMDASMEDLASCPGIGERKVKRLYDTFHEPFKRIIPVRAVNTEAPSENKTGPELSTTEPLDPKEETSSKNANKKKKIEPEITVKSALSAAFAKYTGKMGNKSDRNTEEMSVGTVNEAGSSGNAENSGAETAG